MARREEKFEVDEDSNFQRLEWKVEHIAWVVWLLIIAAALAGLLGPGPLSGTRAASAGGELEVEFNRIERRKADSELTFRIAPSSVREGALRLWTAADFLDKVDIRGIQPEPREVVHAGGRISFVFSAENTGATAVIRFHVQASKTGWGRHVFGVEGGPEVAVTRFILP
jgi:hypothetical protein